MTDNNDNNNEGKIKCKGCGKYYPVKDFRLTPKFKKLKECKTCRKEITKRKNIKQFGSPEGRFKQSVRSMTRYLIVTEQLEVKGICEKCGKDKKIEVHHPEPYCSRNIVELCRKPCHSEEHPERGNNNRKKD